MCAVHIPLIDDGPQVKKPSIEDPQAVAQAAIAKFVDKYVMLHIMCMCICVHVCTRVCMCMCGDMKEWWVLASPIPQSWSAAGSTANDDC